MSLTAVILICAGGLYVGANIGANDAANCIGAPVGAGLIRYRTAILIVALFVILGAVLQGGEVTKTLGKGIVTETISTWGVLTAMACAGLFVTIATFKRIPVSTSQAVVGAVAGVGVAADLNVAWAKTLTIFECWVICPIVTAVMTYLLYAGLRRGVRRIGHSHRLSTVLRWAVVAASAYSAYSLGAGHLGMVIGPITALDNQPVDHTVLVLAGTVSIAAGALLFGKGVATTVGGSIVQLDLLGAFSVQAALAFGLHIFAMAGIPVSSSQGVVGALLGIGLYHGVKAVSKRKIAEVVVGWVLTPTLAGAASYGIHRLLIFTGRG
jgi:PiT family inorganic phosphate transporter